MGPLEPTPSKGACIVCVIFRRVGCIFKPLFKQCVEIMCTMCIHRVYRVNIVQLIHTDYLHQNQLIYQVHIYV